jgi:hypothetical protein
MFVPRESLDCAGADWLRQKKEKSFGRSNLFERSAIGSATPHTAGAFPR